MKNIKVAIIGIGNCASSLIQGIHYYTGKQERDVVGLMHWSLGGYIPTISRNQWGQSKLISPRSMGSE